MRTTLAFALVGLVTLGGELAAQVKVERPLTLQTTLQVETAVIARYDSLETFLQSSARDKLTLISVELQKQLIQGADSAVLVASARNQLSRQFPSMTTAQQDRMLFLALAGAVEAEQGTNDSLGDVTTATSLTLQTYLDRRSKLISTLSNMMKKASDTSASIVSNLK